MVFMDRYITPYIQEDLDKKMIQKKDLSEWGTDQNRIKRVV